MWAKASTTCCNVPAMAILSGAKRAWRGPADARPPCGQPAIPLADPRQRPRPKAPKSRKVEKRAILSNSSALTFLKSMHLLPRSAARKHDPLAGIARCRKPDHPRVVHHPEIQHSAQKIGRWPVF